MTIMMTIDATLSTGSKDAALTVAFLRVGAAAVKLRHRVPKANATHQFIAVKVTPTEATKSNTLKEGNWPAR